MANNEITCGNSYSTLWHVTAYLDEATAIALIRRRPSSPTWVLLIDVRTRNQRPTSSSLFSCCVMRRRPMTPVGLHHAMPVPQQLP